MNDLNDLYYFVQVVDHRGFAPAGRALGEPKSKLSRRIALLEERLGVRLIQRSTPLLDDRDGLQYLDTGRWCRNRPRARMTGLEPETVSSDADRERRTGADRRVGHNADGGPIEHERDRPDTLLCCP